MKLKNPIMFAGLALAVFGGVFFAMNKSAETVTPILPPPVKKISEVDLTALSTKAEAGDAAAQTSLGKMYLDGNSVKADMKAAVRWLKLAADQNNADALAALGELTQAGQGVKRDLDAAVKLYQRAAEAGSVAGQYDLAYLYEQGTGVKQGEQAAAKWYQLAAEGGDPTAQFDIGQRYQLGLGVTTNLVQSYKWLALAAAQGQADSITLLSSVKREMSGEELAQAQQLVSQFTPRRGK